MPGRNGTGPMGMGRLTGRGMGFCNDSRSFGMMGGFGNGMGLGLGCRRGYGRFALNDDLYSEDKKNLLTREKNILEARLDLVKKELEKFEKPSTNE